MKSACEKYVADLKVRFLSLLEILIDVALRIDDDSRPS